MTYDLNMLKKVTGELVWEIKSVSSSREKHKFPVETNKMYQVHDNFTPPNKNIKYIQ